MKTARVAYGGAIHSAAPDPAGLRLADGRVLAEQDVVWLPPFEVGTIIALGLNYADHVKELSNELTVTARDEPLVFLKGPGSLIGHRGFTRRPQAVKFMHYECELAVVIGATARRVKAADAMRHVAGYTVCNDVSDRRFRINPQRKQREKDAFFDWQHGKWHDTFLPCGPCVTSAADMPNPQRQRMRLRVNGETMQDGNTGQMIFPVAAIVSILSSFTTLEPGDLIVTGTPSGVGHARRPPIYLKARDVVECEIEGIGTLRNPVENEA